MSILHAVTRATAAVILLAGPSVWAQSDTTVESSRAVASPDGSKTAVVDRFTPVVDGEEERFSGRMLIRVSSADGSGARQRYIEASQVRVIQPPVWIDNSRVCAFVYNVAKNSNGIVYFVPEANRALQVEFVMPTRQMAASGQLEQELTSLEVTEFSGQDTVMIRNVPWKGGSAFPLVLSELPAFDGRPYGMDFLNRLNNALAAYKDFLQQNSLPSLEPEQASESFNNSESWVGMLACGGTDFYVVSVPLLQEAPSEVLSKAKIQQVPGILLGCSQQAAGEGFDPVQEEGRYLTAWQDDTTLQVIKETYDLETDAPKVTPVMSLNVTTGAVQNLSTTGTQQSAM